MAETAGPARIADEAAEAQAYGLTSDDLRDWAAFSPIEIFWALKHDVTPATARRWAREGLRICDTVRAIALGMTPEEVRLWATAGFTPPMRSRRNSWAYRLRLASPGERPGFILPDAALLIHDGWTLKEAVNAQYEDIADEDWMRW